MPLNPRLQGKLSNFLPGDPNWAYNQIPDRMQKCCLMSPRTNLDWCCNFNDGSADPGHNVGYLVSQTAYFGGLGLGYEGANALEFVEDPRDERAGRIVKKMFKQEYLYSDSPKILQILKKTNFQFLNYLRYFANQGIHTSVEKSSPDSCKIIIKTHDEKKFNAVCEEMQKFDLELKLGNYDILNTNLSFNQIKNMDKLSHSVIYPCMTPCPSLCPSFTLENFPSLS